MIEDYLNKGEKMAKNNNLGDFLAGIANKIRGLLGTTDPINP